MSTDYYALRKPFTSFRPEIMGGHIHVGIWVNNAKSGTLVFRNDEWKEAILLFICNKPTMRTHWGGDVKGMVVSEKTKTLLVAQQMISEYGELTTVGEIRNKAKS